MKKRKYKRQHKEPVKMSTSSSGQYRYDDRIPNHKILNRLLDITWEIKFSLDFTDVKWDAGLKQYFQRNVLPMLDDFRVELEEHFKEDPEQKRLETLNRLKRELEEMRF